MITPENERRALKRSNVPVGCIVRYILPLNEKISTSCTRLMRDAQFQQQYTALNPTSNQRTKSNSSNNNNTSSKQTDKHTHIHTHSNNHYPQQRQHRGIIANDYFDTNIIMISSGCNSMMMQMVCLLFKKYFSSVWIY